MPKYSLGNDLELLEHTDKFCESVWLDPQNFGKTIKMTLVRVVENSRGLKVVPVNAIEVVCGGHRIVLNEDHINACLKLIKEED